MMTTLILSIAISWLIVKIIKTIIVWKKEERVNWEALLYDGGMPSSHTTLVVSTATALFLETGFSALFALGVVLALIVMNDALKVRKITEEQSKVINKLIEGKTGFKKMDEHVGHTAAEVLVGLIFGIVIPIIIYALI